MSAASLEIIEVHDADRPAWDSFVESAAGEEAGHRWQFHEVLGGVFGQRIIRLVARRGDRWVAVLPLVFQKSFIGRFLVSVPYLNYAGVLGSGSADRRALAERAVAIAGELNVDRLEIRGRDGRDLPIETPGGKCSYTLELPDDPQALWATLKAKLRSQVKRPEKEGYRAGIVEHGGRMRFYPLLARRWHELGSPVLPESFFERIEAAFGADLEYVLVEANGKQAAAGVLLYAGDTAEMAWAASAGEHNRFGVNMLLYWAALERAIDRRVCRFDFGRSTPGTGNARFKLQWGAKEQPLHWNVRVAARRGHASERGDPRRDLVATVWRRVPEFITRRLGPLLAARLPY